MWLSSCWHDLGTRTEDFSGKFSIFVKSLLCFVFRNLKAKQDYYYVFTFAVDSKSSTTVVVNIYLRSINDIDDYKMEFSVQVTFREQWNDERLRFDDFEGNQVYSSVRCKEKFQWKNFLFTQVVSNT